MKPPRLLLTRPAEDSARLAERLRRRGVATLVDPMLEPRLLDLPPLDRKDYAAVLVTSRHGVRALARLTERRDLPVLAVGDATAEAARAAGFAAIESAGGDAEALARLVADRFAPDAGPLLHVAGDAARDLASLLPGFTVERLTAYESHPAAILRPATVRAIRTNALDGAMFFSPRTALAFGTLAERRGLAARCRHMDAFCISPATGEAARRLPWRRVVVAAAPNADALIAATLAALGQTAPKREREGRSWTKARKTKPPLPNA